MTTEQANPLAGTRLAFIGAGVMAEAMIAGILKQGQATPDQIAKMQESVAKNAENH